MTLAKLELVKVGGQHSREEYVLPDISANASQRETPRALLRLLRTVTVAATFSAIGNVAVSRVVVLCEPDCFAVANGNGLFKANRGTQQSVAPAQQIAKADLKNHPFLSQPAFEASNDDLELESPISGYKTLPREERRKITLRRRGYNIG